MWIARDNSGDLFLYSDKPTVDEKGVWANDSKSPKYFYDDGLTYSYGKLNPNAYPEVTFENSPKELKIKW